MENRNIYAELASIPPEIADEITNAKTGGGRSLNAIHASKTLNQLEKHLLLVLGSQMNFCKDFVNQYRYISLNDLAEKLSINQRTVSSLLNGIKRKGKHIPGLIEKGYVNKQVPTQEEQMKWWKTHYCITNKIFSEYMIFLIEEHKRKKKEGLIQDQRGGSDPGSEGVVILDQMGSDLGSDKDPSYKDPSYKDPSILNAVEKKPAAVKKLKKTTWKSLSKMKAWEEKTDDEKRDTILNRAVDAHDLAIEMRQAKFFPYNDVPDLLAPILSEHGIEKVKEFFEALKNENRGCDVRKLSKFMKRFACPAIPAESEPTEPNFPEKIIEQVETNTMYIATNPIKLDEVKVESFPIRLKKFYDSLKSKRERISLQKEIALLGLESFLKMRATAIIRCSYEELFVESVPCPAFF